MSKSKSLDVLLAKATQSRSGHDCEDRSANRQADCSASVPVTWALPITRETVKRGTRTEGMHAVDVKGSASSHLLRGSDCKNAAASMLPPPIAALRPLIDAKELCSSHPPDVHSEVRCGNSMTRQSAEDDQTQCPLCTMRVNRGDLIAHLDHCDQNLQSCPHCLEGIAVALMHEHAVMCIRNTRQCYVCQQQVPAQKIAEHLSQCGRGKVLTMYHGTSLEAAKAIMRGGFKPSVKGLLGEGVYVTKDIEKASKYGPVILECEVHVGSVAVINKKHHPMQKCWASHGFDAAWIPPLSGVVSSGLEEHCVADPKRIAPLRMYSAPIDTH